MALISSKDSLAEISDKAALCPKCGVLRQDLPELIEEENEASIEQLLELRWLCFSLSPRGHILNIINRYDSPEKAKIYLNATGIGHVFDIGPVV